MPKEYGTPGPRALHPDVCTSKSLARCGLLGQLLWDRLIAQADDQGRLEDGAEYIKAVCVPMVKGATEAQVEKALGELEREEMIIRYVAASRDLIQLRNWWQYQSGMRWSYPSRWPAPDGWKDRVERPPRKDAEGALGGFGANPNPVDDPAEPLNQDAEFAGTDPTGAAGLGGPPTSRTPAGAPLRPGASRASQPDPTGRVPDPTEPGPAGPPRPPTTAALTVELVEELTGRPFTGALGSKTRETLMEDVAALGESTVQAAYRAVHAEANGAPLDAAGLVFGGHKRLYPIPAGGREASRAQTKGFGPDLDEVRRAANL